MTRRHESTSFRTSAIVLGFSVLTILIFITLSNLLAPEKPDAPRNSIITFESPPPLEIPDFEFDTVPSTLSRSSQTPTEPPKEIYHDENFATVVGTVSDAKTGDPIENTIIRAQWKRTIEEKEAFEVLREELEEDESVNSGDVLFVPNERHSDYQEAFTGKDGTFVIYIPYDRPATLGFTAKGYIYQKHEDVEFSREETSGPLLISLSKGASISGRVYNLATNEGIPGMNLNLDPNADRYNQISTDENGNYIISGLTPGDFEITVQHRDTRFKPGKVLPYQRLNIDYETEEKVDVDFGLTRAGVVWGYTRTPEENAPITAQVLLVGSENMISQGINAAMSEFKEKQRIFSSYSSDDDGGYYELAGVPLNEEWRVYATSTERAPQLSEPFILTESSPDIRVDINMLNGSAVYGKVVDESGFPIEGAEVFCIPGFADFFAPLKSAKTVRQDNTEEDGSFAIDDLPSGSYNIFAFQKGFKLTARGTPIFPDGQNDINNIVVGLHHIENEMHIVYGIVSDSSGEPVSGALVEMGGFSLNDLMSDETNSESRSIETNQFGEYLFEEVSLGTYGIQVSKQGYPKKTITKVYLDKPTDITLGGGARISGTVYIRETGSHMRESFNIAANVEVKLTFDIKNPLKMLENLSGGENQTFEDTDGDFEILVAPGDYKLRASATDYLNDEIQISVHENDNITGVKLYLSRTGGSIEGQVRTADGLSPQGARVRLTHTLDDIVGLIESAESGESKTVGEDGLFRFEMVPNGNFTIVASHPEYAATQYGPIVIQNSDNINRIDIILGSGGTLEGRVFNRGQPIPNVIVMILNAVSPISATTNSDGYYEIEGLNAGEHHVIAVSPFAFNSATVQSQLGDVVIIETGKTTQKDLELTEVEIPELDELEVP
jgi:large repetitive protein